MGGTSSPRCIFTSKRGEFTPAATVNGKEVYNTDASNVDASGVIGYRVNHNLDVHLSAIGIHPLH